MTSKSLSPAAAAILEPVEDVERTALAYLTRGFLGNRAQLRNNFKTALEKTCKARGVVFRTKGEHKNAACDVLDHYAQKNGLPRVDRSLDGRFFRD